MLRHTPNARRRLMLDGHASLRCARITTVLAVVIGAIGSGRVVTDTPAVICLFSQNTVATLRSSTYSGGSWGTNKSLPNALLSEAAFVRCSSTSVRTETLCVALDDKKAVSFLSFNGAEWGTVTTLCTDTGDKDNRMVDVAHESNSGDGLVVYWKNSSAQFGYRTWDGSTLSGESLLPPITGATGSKWLTLYARPGSDEVILLAQTKSNGFSLAANMWNGIAWKGWTTLSTALATDAKECFGLAFQGVSNTALVVYGEASQNQPRYNTWDGSTWSTQSLLPTVGNEPQWVRLAADPASDTVLFACLDGGSDVEVNTWDGSAWGANLQIEPDLGGSAQRRFDLCYENGTSKALLMYRQKNKNYPMYRVWSGSSWGSEQSGPNIGRKTMWVQLLKGVTTGTVHAAVSDDSDDLHLLTWSGASMSGDTSIENNLGQGTGATEPFRLAPTTLTFTVPTIKSWVEVQPN